MQGQAQAEKQPFWDTEVLIVDLPKGRDIVRVKRVTKNGHVMVDVREHYIPSYSPDPDNWLPTKKGLTLPIELAGVLANALNKALEL